MMMDSTDTNKLGAPLLRVRSAESTGSSASQCSDGAAAAPPQQQHHNSNGSSNGYHHSTKKPVSSRAATSQQQFYSKLTICRWILLGVMIGSSTTVFFQSVSMPVTFCIGTPKSATKADFTIPTDAISTGDEFVHPLLLKKHQQFIIDAKDDSNGDDNNHNSHHHHGHKSARDKYKEMHARRKSSNGIPTTTTESDTTAIRSQNTTTTTTHTTTEEDDNTPPFINLPPPPVLGQNDSFAACLLIKDDNHWLIEWLAYHYQVMPLRSLIVVVDPDSKTSPRKILGRWNNRGLMKIRVWKDRDFMPQKITARSDMFDNNTQLMMHRVRQNNFYRRCIPTLRQRGHQWVMLVDTDEYILPSYASGHFRNLTSQVSFQEGGSVLRLLKYHEQVSGINNTCVYMPRFFFGARESRRELVQHAVPPPIQPFHMVTQRFLYREPRRNFNGKNLINLERVQNLKVFGGVHNVAQACPAPDNMRKLNHNKHSLIRCHHYLGTKEQYLYRDDPRQHNDNVTTKVGSYVVRGLDRYNEFNEKANHEDHAAKAWIRGFIKEMGSELAAELLEGVGELGVE